MEEFNIDIPFDYAIVYAVVGWCWWTISLFAWGKIGDSVDNYFGVWQKEDCQIHKSGFAQREEPYIEVPVDLKDVLKLLKDELQLPDLDQQQMNHKARQTEIPYARGNEADGGSQVRDLANFFRYMRSKCRPIILDLINLLRVRPETEWQYLSNGLDGHKLEICLKLDNRELVTVTYTNSPREFLPRITIYGPTPERGPWLASGVVSEIERFMFFVYFGDIWTRKTGECGTLRDEIVDAINSLTISRQ